MRPAAVIVIAYLLGSIPFGYLIVRTTQGADIRETGSGATGATNVSRRAGKLAGVLTLVLDALKGAAAVLMARWILQGNVGQPVNWWIAFAAILVIVGHMFPVWLGFSGGKGVATAIGVFLVLATMALALAGVLFLLIVWLTRYVSLGSIVAACAIPLLVLLENAFVQPVEPLVPIMFGATAIAALIVFAHRQNIGRLIQGTESKFA
ncbi:MAG: glycerol-3-phosphate 1-O-acyltransferase PlsY [Acidobacteriota bacterium]